MVKVIDIRLCLSTLKSSVTYGKKNRKVNDNEIITIDQIMRRIEEIKIGNNIALKRKLSLFNFNKDIVLNVFKENIEKIIDGSRTEVVGFKTAEKFIDVFLNV